MRTVINIPTSLADLTTPATPLWRHYPASQKNRLSFIRFCYTICVFLSNSSFFLPAATLVANEMAKEKIPEELGLALVLTVYG